MAAIFYQYKRLETEANLIEDDSKDPRCQTEEGRSVLVLNFIKRNFTPSQIREILGALNPVDRNAIQVLSCFKTNILLQFYI